MNCWSFAFNKRRLSRVLNFWTIIADASKLFKSVIYCPTLYNSSDSKSIVIAHWVQWSRKNGRKIRHWMALSVAAKFWSARIFNALDIVIRSLPLAFSNRFIYEFAKAKCSESRLVFSSTIVPAELAQIEPTDKLKKVICSFIHWIGKIKIVDLCSVRIASLRMIRIKKWFWIFMMHANENMHEIFLFRYTWTKFLICTGVTLWLYKLISNQSLNLYQPMSTNIFGKS